jgi:hypothetical protein
MNQDLSGVLHYSNSVAANASPDNSSSYVLLAKRLYMGTSAVNYSEALPMEGYNAVFVECTVFTAAGAPDPKLVIYVQVSNDGQNWDTLPLGSTAIGLSIATYGYFKLDQSTIGQQISAAYVRLKYVTDAATTNVIFSVGIDRKRQGI